MPFDATPVTTPGVLPDSSFWRTILLRAADIMERHGGCKGELENEHNQVCALGAISVAVYGNPAAIIYNSEEVENGCTPIGRAIVVLHNYIDLYLTFRPRLAIAAWNNDPERPTAEISNAMRAAARTSVLC